LVGCIGRHLAGETREFGPSGFEPEEGFGKLEVLFNSGDFVVDAVAFFLKFLQSGLVGSDPLIQADGDVF